MVGYIVPSALAASRQTHSAVCELRKVLTSMVSEAKALSVSGE